MRGFVTSYSHAGVPITDDAPAVMGYYTNAEVPVTGFFAESFAICDQWFAPIPTGTQPNRLMAMAGYTLIDDNVIFIPDHDLVYQWLSQRNISWRVYSQAAPFFILMDQWRKAILLDRGRDYFRRIDRLPYDVADEKNAFPQVVFIEPSYTDAHLAFPNDDHPPTSITRGQELFRKVYRALTANPKRWARTALIVTYDEHGGFFDHVSPFPYRTEPPPGATYGDPFLSSGPRVPAMIVSPLVSPARVFSKRLDHTSILQLLGDKFGDGVYSDVVSQRQSAAKLASLAEIFDLDAPREHVPSAPEAAPFPPAFNQNSAAFQEALKQFERLYPDEAADHFPDLIIRDD